MMSALQAAGKERTVRIGALQVEESHFVSVSFATTLLSGAVKLAMGLMMQSAVVLANAAFNMVLCVPKALALASGRLPGMRGRALFARKSTEAASAGRTRLLTALSLVVLGAVFLVFGNHVRVTGETLHLSIIPAISFATCAFAKIGVSIYGLRRAWGDRGGVVFSCKLTNFADGLASIALTQTVLRGLEGPSGDVFDAGFSMAVGAVIVFLGVWQLARLRPARRREHG